MTDNGAKILAAAIEKLADAIRGAPVNIRAKGGGGSGGFHGGAGGRLIEVELRGGGGGGGSTRK